MSKMIRWYIMVIRLLDLLMSELLSYLFKIKIDLLPSSGIQFK